MSTTSAYSIDDEFNQDRELQQPVVRGRRWRPGAEVEVDGLQFRVVQGRKPDVFGRLGHDLRLEVYSGSTWRPVRMALGALMADFFYENEDALYPPDVRKGGQKYLTYVRTAAKFGWAAAERTLQSEKNEHQRRLFDD